MAAKQLRQFLKSNALDDEKWVDLFQKEKITKPEHIQVIKGSSSYEKYKTLSSQASGDEQKILKKLLGIAPDAELKETLKNAGLDEEKWAKHLKDLGVTTPQALSHVGKESYAELDQNAKQPWEKNALRKLLGIENEETAMNEKLKEAGLDPDRWSGILRNKLGVKTPQELSQVGKESYTDLQGEANQQWEKDALRKLLGIENEETAMNEKLKQAGLDPDRWSGILRNKLGVKTPQALSQVGKESYTDLQGEASQQWEKDALRKFLGMEDEKTSRKKEVEKKREQSLQMLEKLKQLQAEGKERLDSEVQRIESGVREALDVSPEVWAPKNETLDTVIRDIEGHLDQLGGTLKTREDLKDVSLLQHASGGQALEGIMLSTDLNNMLQTRDKLLKAPDYVELMGASLLQKDIVQEFTSEIQEDHFTKSISRFGASGSFYAIGFYEGFVGAGGVSYSYASESEETAEHHQKELYHSTIKNSFMPLASCYLSDSQLQLSEGALKDLRMIEDIAMCGGSPCTIKSLCEQFFYKFGSHANKGKFNFGGVYSWKSYSKGFQESDRGTLKTLQRHAVTASVSGGFGFFGFSAEATVSHLKAAFEAKNVEKLITQTQLEQTSKGGPPEASSLSIWKTGLVASNSTWCLIDCGEETVPVWKIIQLNHGKDFRNPQRIAKVLSQTWEQMTELSLQSTRMIWNDMIEIWNDEKDVLKCAQHLTQLLQIKQDLVSKSMNPQSWSKILSQTHIQNYLRSIMLQPGEGLEQIKLLMKQLIKPSSVRVTNDLLDIYQWLYHTKESEATSQVECESLMSLKEILYQNLENVSLIKADESGYIHEQSEDARVHVTINVTQAVNCLREHFKKLKYMDLYLVTLLFPCEYDESKRIFLHLLSISDLEYLCRELVEFAEMPPRESQASLFHIAVKTYTTQAHVSVSEAQTKRHLEYLWKEIQGDADPQIYLVLVQFRSGDHDWFTLQSNLNDLIQDIVPIHSSHIIFPTAQPLEHSPTNTQLPEGIESSVQAIFEQTGLLEYYPQKLTLQKILLHWQEMLGSNQCNDPKLLPFFIVQKIMMQDYKAALLQEKTLTVPSVNEVQLHHYDSDAVDSDDESNAETDADTDSDDESNAETDADTDSEDTLWSTFHPVDTLLALLHCCDNFLCQHLTARLSTCQLAIPLLLQDPFTKAVTLPIWAMRSITKEWKMVDPSGEHTTRTCRIINYPAPIVSLYQFANTETVLSKSKLLNDLIGDCPQSCFLDCSGESFLMDGLVELFWYLPTGKANDPYPNVVAFTNFCGDVRNQSKQIAFLSRMSSVNVVLVTEDDLDERGIEVLKELAQARGRLCLMLQESELSQEAKDERWKLLNETIKQKHYEKVELRNKSAAEIKDSIRKRIRKLTCSEENFQRIADSTDIARELGIEIDEDNSECIEGKDLATGILRQLSTSDKEDALLLQSKELWHQWARLDKEKHRRLYGCAKGTEQYNSEKEEQKFLIRMKQLSCFTDCKYASLMNPFISVLLNHKGNIRDYFLHWLKFTLDDAKLEQRMACISYGIEHFIREIGQMYETVVQLQPEYSLSELSIHDVERLPQVAAELLVSGYPLELMDGDTAHIPLQWVTAVLDKVNKLLENSQLCVLSVVGTKSTGKSTLLNTMFGLPFSATSAFKSTRGTFIQLLPLSHSLTEVKCDYLLVVDAEELQAPEPSSKERRTQENEFTAFVLGLANAAIINISAESPCDMDDVLEIVVHAFIRMQHVILNPCCHFVYHKAGTMSDQSRRMSERVQLREKLDKITMLAAREEHLDGHYTSISDVIDFDENRNVWHFPSSWIGDPPMASENLGYLECAQQLKSSLIKITSLRYSINLERLINLWNAVLDENIFAFKNTLEMSTYNSLEARYAQWSWTFQQRMLMWEQKARHRSLSTDSPKLADLERQLIDIELPNYVAEIHTELCDEMAKFFEQHHQHDILAQWRDLMEVQLTELMKEREVHATNHCKVLMRSQQALTKLKQRYYGERLLQVKQLASSETLKSGQLVDTFERMWDAQTSKLIYIHELQYQHEYVPDIAVSFESSLREVLRTYGSILIPKLTEKPLRSRAQKSLNFIVNREKHIIGNKTLGNPIGEIDDSHFETAQRETAKYIVQAKQYLATKRDQSFNIGFCHELLRDLIQAIDVAQQNLTDFNFTPLYKVDIAIALSGYAVTVFEQIAELFKSRDDPVQYLKQEMKTHFLCSFQRQYHQIAKQSETTARVCSLLVKATEEAIQGSLAKKIVDDMKHSFKHFSTKASLKAQVLCDLAEGDSFADYLEYLYNVNSSLQKWIKKYVQQHCEQDQGGNSRLFLLADLELERLAVIINGTINHVTDMKLWLYEFHRVLVNELPLGPSEIKEVDEAKALENFVFFREELCKGLAQLHAGKFTFLSMDQWVQKPYDILYRSLAGCTEQCPFCKEQCDMEVSGHDCVHFVEAHRPGCLGRGADFQVVVYGSLAVMELKMELKTCNELLESKESFTIEKKSYPYSKYRDVYPSWHIPTASVDPAHALLQYWKWFVANYANKIADHIKTTVTELPVEWSSLKVGEVVAKLKQRYLT